MPTQPNVTSLSVPGAPANDAAQLSAWTSTESLIFLPGASFAGGGNLSGNRFNTAGLTALATTAATVLGSKTVDLDFSSNADVYANAAALNFGASTRLRGIINAANGVVPALTTTNTLAAVSEIDNLVLNVATTKTFATTPPTLTLRRRTTIASDGTAHLMDVAGTARIGAQDNTIIGDATNAVIGVGAAGTLTIDMFGGANLKASAVTITAGGSLIINRYSDGAIIDNSYLTLTGVTINYLGSAIGVGPDEFGGTGQADLFTTASQITFGNNRVVRSGARAGTTMNNAATWREQLTIATSCIPAGKALALDVLIVARDSSAPGDMVKFLLSLLIYNNAGTITLASGTTKDTATLVMTPAAGSILAIVGGVVSGTSPLTGYRARVAAGTVIIETQGIDGGNYGTAVVPQLTAI